MESTAQWFQQCGVCGSSTKKCKFNVIALTGKSPGDYKDLKPTSNVKVEDGTLSISNIQKNNEGYYLCEAVNGIGSGLSAVIMISVQGMSVQNQSWRWHSNLYFLKICMENL